MIWLDLLLLIMCIGPFFIIITASAIGLLQRKR